MVIKNLILKNFRNYHDLNINFNDGLNIIIGDNAQGKTNIIEAIYYLSITKSFLGINDKDLISFNNEYSSITGKIIDNNIKSKKLLISISSKDKKLFINNKEIKKHYEFIGNFKTVIFTPDDLRLIKEGPQHRRKFLNIHLSQINSNYINYINEYNVLLKQRNEYLKLLRENKKNDLYFSILNNKLANLSVNIYNYRKNFIDLINKYINNIFYDISGFDGLYIKYITNVNIDENLEKNLLCKLNDNLNREIAYGSTLFGPHRDDFEFSLNDNDLILYGSTGQLKLSILALKLSLINVFYEYSGIYPVLLLDDLFSELDVNKRNNVIKYLNNDVQSIITTTDLNNISHSIIDNSFIYKIQDGSVVEFTDYKREVRDNNE